MHTGIDIILCCHNSADRLPTTLGHIAAQTGVSPDEWTLVLVDNGSSDGTADVATRIWRDLGSPTALQVVAEERLGLGYARVRGIEATQREFLCFVDDDNWICPEWVQRALATLRGSTSIGAVGGRSEAAFAETPPKWFYDAAGGYAIGRQAERSGDVTEGRGYLYGAGLCLRRKAVLGLFDQGFEFLNAGRAGARLASGDDQELCLALRLAGWRLWYEDSMVFRHYMPANRLRWSYAKAMFAGFGRSGPTLSCYRNAYRIPADDPDIPDRWQRMLLQTLKSIARHIKQHPTCILKRNVHALRLRALVARAVVIAGKRSEIDRLADTLRCAAWNLKSAPRAEQLQSAASLTATPNETS